MEKEQFRVLYRVFLLRVIDLELLSSNGDPTKLLGQFAALLSGVSFLFCLPLLMVGGRWHDKDLWIMEHLFLATTMLATGLISVLNWDSIFPDRRDVLVLAPLPVASRTIFLAKLAALLYGLGLSVLALNVFTGLAWPLFFSTVPGALALLRTYAAYWTTSFAAAAFMFFSVLTAQGLASYLLPRQIFLRLSAFFQVGAFALLLGTFILEPTNLNAEILKAPVVHWIPTFWFFGLFQQLNGASSPMQPLFASLTQQAYWALALAFAGGTATLLLSYRRTLRKIVEAPEIQPVNHRIKWPSLLSDSLPGAVLLFSLRTLLRSRPHRVILSFYFGVGFAIVLAYVAALFAMAKPLPGTTSVFVSPPLLAASLLMMCVAVVGIRMVSPMPIALCANWIFRITESRTVSEYRSCVRRTWVVLGVVPIWLVSMVLFLPLWPWSLALEHAVVLGLFGMILVELCLFGFEKVPFTCGYQPGKGNLQYVFWACAFLLLPLIGAGAQLEMHMLTRPLGYAGLLTVLGAILIGLKWQTAATSHHATQIGFDEKEAPLILSMSLPRD